MKRLARKARKELYLLGLKQKTKDLLTWKPLLLQPWVGRATTLCSSTELLLLMDLGSGVFSDVWSGEPLYHSLCWSQNATCCHRHQAIDSLWELWSKSPGWGGAGVARGGVDAFRSGPPTSLILLIIPIPAGPFSLREEDSCAAQNRKGHFLYSLEWKNLIPVLVLGTGGGELQEK